MYKNYHFAWLILSVLLSSCAISTRKSTVPIIILHKEYDIETDFHYETSKIFGFKQKHHINESGELILNSLTWPDWKLYRSNLTQGKVLDTIDCNIYPYQFIQDFCFVSPDTILLAFNATYLGDDYDKALIFMDRNKKIVDTVSLAGAPLQLAHGQNINFKETPRYWINYSHFPLVYRKGKIYCPLGAWDLNSECSAQKNLIGVVSHKPAAAFKRLPINMECAPEGYFWGHDYRRPYGVWGRQFLYTSFGNSPTVYQYNDETGTVKSAYIPFVTIDTIEPYTIPDPLEYDGYKSQFYELFYAPRERQLIWTTRIGCDSSDSPLCTNILNFIYSFAFIDENLKKVGEGLIPEEYTYRFIPYKEGFLLPKKSCKKATFGYFTYSIVEGDPAILKKQIRERRERMNQGYVKLPENEMLANYMKEITNEKASPYRKAILIPETSCPACQPAYARLIGKYQEKLAEKGIAVILIYDDTGNMNEFIKQIADQNKKNTKWRTSDNMATLYQDTTQKYLRYFPLWVNLRYIEFDTAGNLKYDKIINPGDIAEFEKRIAE